MQAALLDAMELGPEAVVVPLREQLAERGLAGGGGRVLVSAS